MVLFEYIRAKDTFQMFYIIRLSRRLIHRLSASDESEAIMISKLKRACGGEYTRRMEHMLTGSPSCTSAVLN